MALKDIQLSTMAFPQRWDGPSGTLSLNILLLPVGDPTAPLGSGPKFVGTAVPLVVNFASGLAALPSSATTATSTKAFTATPQPVAPALYTQIYNQLVSKGIVVNSGPLTVAPDAGARIKKSLPDSYINAAPFSRSLSPDVIVGDGYGCALRDQAPALNAALPKPDSAIAWGQILSYALRQPVLARAMGLIYSVDLVLGSNGLAAGGFLWVTLDGSNGANPWVADGKATPSKVRSYAARIPVSDVKQNRPLFGAVLLPIVDTPPSNLAIAQLEAEEYDDGFAQIVHTSQPTSVDAATLDAEQIAPGTDAGIQIGWDDEQVTAWLNNQVDVLRDRVNGTSNAAEAPLGVQGYRVDVREVGAKSWNSLCVVNGTLPFDQLQAGAGAATSISGNEFWVAPAPIRPATNDNVTNAARAWLPLYFAQWTGKSLVLADPVVSLLAFGAQNAGVTPHPPLPSTVLPNPYPDTSMVPNLRYGNAYEFRVRLTDLTGNGPVSTDEPVHPGTSATSQTTFLRYVPPKALEVATSPAPPPPPAKPPAVRRIETLTVQRPRIGYPEALFAGVDTSTFALSSLGNLIQQAWASRRAISVPDPDVDRFEVVVEAQAPVGDTGDLDGTYRVIYSLEVPFPDGDDPKVVVTLDYTDGVDEIAKIAAPPDGTTTLPIPTSRNVRVRLTPKAKDQSGYYGSDAAKVGLTSDYVVRQEASVEDAIFASDPELELQAFYLQPGDNLAQLLAQEIGVQQNGLSFAGQPGVRTVFGGSGSLRHSVSPDGSVFTFSNQNELLNHWITVLVLDLERDWTWTGFGSPALSFGRGGENIGTILLPNSVSAMATGVPGQQPDRSRTRFIFFDAVNPQPAPGHFPRELKVSYSVTAKFTSASPQEYPLNITLPITTPPTQTPKIVATGIAESPYHHSATYSETSPRDRYLWIEFEQPIQDKDDDNYFWRVLAYGPDPLLAGDLLPKGSAMLPNAAEPALPVDPEPIRMIFSGQSSDESGLDAMTQLVPANPVGIGKEKRHFLLPLPPNVSADDLRLFGFWTYEFRVGHTKHWSTAQGRFGRPLRVTGIQHPAPQLKCSMQRDANQISATAPFAVTIYNGNRMYDFRAGDPQTRIWFMLYTQVLQADGASYRNVLLEHKLGQTLQPPQNKPQHGANFAPMANAGFDQKEIEARLALLRMPKFAPLSMLAVEVLPGPLTMRVGERGIADNAAVGNEGEDPLGFGLGTRRILRTSTLTAVPAIC